MSIVTLAQAKARLRIDLDESDEDYDLLLEQASAIVVDYLKLPVGTYDLSNEDESDWQAAPEPVKAAVCLVFGHLDKDREGAADPLTPAVRSLLHRYRDPALA